MFEGCPKLSLSDCFWNYIIVMNTWFFFNLFYIFHSQPLYILLRKEFLSSCETLSMFKIGHRFS